MAEGDEAPGSFLHLIGICGSTGRKLCCKEGWRKEGEGEV